MGKAITEAEVSRVVVDGRLGNDKRLDISVTVSDTVIEKLRIERWSMRGVDNIHGAQESLNILECSRVFKLGC